MNVEYDLVIDFARPSKSNTIIISEGDSNSRLCRFVLLSNKQSFDMLDVSTATVKGVKSDGSVIYGDGTIVKDDDGNNINEVTYTLPAAVSDISGKTTMTITLMSVRGEIITSFEFYVQTRNSLYSEDDYISDSDLSGFRDLLNRSNAALEKMEQMTQAEALPNPYPLNIYTNTEEYHYSGTETVDVDLGDIAYLAEDPNFDIDAVDETAAGIAVAAASQASASATSAASSATAANNSKNQVASMALDVAASATQAATSATNAARSAVVAGECETEVKAVQSNINSIIDTKVTTITTQLAGAMIDDIIEDAESIRDQAGDYATASQTSATNAAASATQAATTAASINVGATQILSSGTHIADLNVNGVVTELYAPAADTPATEATNITYDHSTSGLEADNAQDAIDELASSVSSISSDLSDAEDDIDEIKSDLSNLSNGSNVKVTFDSSLVGKSATLTKGTKVYTKTVGTDSTCLFKGIEEVGTFTIACDGNTMSVSMPCYSYYEFELGTYGFQGWLDSAGITTTFTSLAGVLADQPTVRILMTKHDSVDYLVEWLDNDSTLSTTLLASDNALKWIGLRDYAYDSMPSAFITSWLGGTKWEYALKDKVPTMTSNSAPYGTAFADYEASPRMAYYGFDGNNTTLWTTNNSTTNHHIGYTFTNPICINKLSIIPYWGTQSRAKFTVIVQGSNDGFTTKTDIATLQIDNIQNSGSVGQKQTVSFANTSYFLSWRIVFSGNMYTDGTYAHLYELQFYGRSLSVSVPTMTSNTSPWGEAFGENRLADNTYWYEAFDGIIKNYCALNVGGIVGYDFKNATVIKALSFINRSVSGNYVNATKNGKLQGSNDKNVWTDICNVVNPSSTSGAIGTVTINNSTPYRYYRLVTVDKYSSAETYICLSYNLYGLDYSEHSERHYIYDNGVELEQITQISSTSVGSATKNADNLYVSKTSSSGGQVGFYSNKVNMTNYNLIRARVKDILVNSTYVKIHVENVTTLDGNALALFELTDRYNSYADISSVNQEARVFFAIFTGTSATASGNVNEIWIE